MEQAAAELGPMAAALNGEVDLVVQAAMERALPASQVGHLSMRLVAEAAEELHSAQQRSRQVALAVPPRVIAQVVGVLAVL